LKAYRIKIGDLGLFRALLKSIEMPERWRNRLHHHFWRPRSFRELLDQLTGETLRPRTSVSAHVDAVAGRDLAAAIAYVENALLDSDLPLLGRSAAEIGERLLEKAQDRAEKRLAPESRKLIDDYLAIEGPIVRCAAELQKCTPDTPVFFTSVESFNRRLREIRKRRIEFDGARFSAVFGRNLEYYTGFVFEIEAGLRGEIVQIAGGGRYDSLMSDIGSPTPIPAVGCAIHTERLLAAVRTTT
jgi:ATP phosphoribosyltransferase regulatory subunit